SLACSRPFGWMSATYCTLPVTSSGPSGRGIDSPTPLTSRVVFITVAMLLSFRARGAAARDFDDRLDHLRVAGAAAQVAGDGVADVVLGRLRVLRQQGGGGHEDAGNTESALRDAVTHECLLHGNQPAAARESLDRDHGPAPRLHRQHEAARDELAVEMNRARATVAGSAALLRTREAQLLALRVEQGDVGLHAGLDVLAVHGEAEHLLGHDESSVQAVARASAMARVRRVSTRTR